MLAQQDNTFKETCQTIFQQNQDDAVRYWCEALEEGERTARTIEYNYKKELAEKDSIIAEKISALAEKDLALAEKDSQIEQLMAEIRQLKELNSHN